MYWRSPASKVSTKFSSDVDTQVFIKSHGWYLLPQVMAEDLLDDPFEVPVEMNSIQTPMIAVATTAKTTKVLEPVSTTALRAA